MTIKQMKELQAKATAAPWFAHIDNNRKYFQIETGIHAVCTNVHCYEPYNEANAAFIAASRSFVPEAIELMEEMADVINIVRKHMQGYLGDPLEFHHRLCAAQLAYEKFKGE